MRTTPFRVLLYAHVDLNVVDGSAYFVAGAASLLTSAAGVEVDVVTATPLQRTVVAEEMLVNPAVVVVDPYRDEGLALRRPEFRTIRRMDEVMAASMLVHYLDRGGYDVVLVRSTQVAGELARLRPGLGPRLCVYVTGVVSRGQDVEEPLLGCLRGLAHGGATLLCQTAEMSEHLGRLLPDTVPPGGVAVMRPSVPARPGSPEPPTDGPLVAAYTGKFARAWNTVQMLSGFKQAVSRTPGMRLLVAGDHFRPEPGWPTFAAEARYLLQSHPQITWVGGVTRDEARDLVSAADVGLGWRSSSLDDSLELSTKILENGSLGRPTIINPTPMHHRLFGSDYPLFAATMADFVDLLCRLDRDRSVLQEAAVRTAEVAADHSYDRVFDDLFPTLLAAADGGAPAGGTDIRTQVTGLVASGARVRVHDGRVTGWLAHAADAERLRGAAAGHGVLEPVERWGPFVGWSTAGGSAEDADVATARALHRTLDAVATRDGSPTALDSVDRVVVHDRRGRVGLGLPAPPPPPTATAEGTEAAQTSARLTAELRRQAEEAARLQQQYTALSGSVLGRVQLSFWRLRRRLRRTVGQG